MVASLGTQRRSPLAHCFRWSQLPNPTSRRSNLSLTFLENQRSLCQSVCLVLSTCLLVNHISNECLKGNGWLYHYTVDFIEDAKSSSGYNKMSRQKTCRIIDYLIDSSFPIQEKPSYPFQEPSLGHSGSHLAPFPVKPEVSLIH